MSYLIKDMQQDNRPRERLLHYGVGSLSNEELLAIILKSGTKNVSSKELANEVLSLVDDIGKLKELTINKLLGIHGIGRVKAIEIIASIELGRRVFQDKKSIQKKLSNPYDIYIFTKDIFEGQKQEHFYCLYLNNKNELIERRLLFMGTVNRSVVHPREVFKYAYLSSASGIICMHNHPSGDVTPSKDDIMFTKALVETGKIQNIPILDHVVVSDDKYFSFSENGMI